MKKVTVKQLFNSYVSSREKFYSREFKWKDEFYDKYESCFKNAKKLCIDLEADVDDFIYSQVYGFFFVNDGCGHFPSPLQLTTYGAETRYLEFNYLSPGIHRKGEVENLIQLYISLHKDTFGEDTEINEVLYAYEDTLESILDEYYYLDVRNNLQRYFIVSSAISLDDFCSLF